MDSRTKNLVLSLAQKVRAWAEDENQRRPVPGPSNLNGWCAIASARLWRALDAAGIRAEIHMASCDYGYHVYLVVDDHVVDVTATQFSEFKRQPILIAHHREVEYHWFYQSEDVFLDASELRTHQQRTGWPSDQTALPA